MLHSELSVLQDFSSGLSLVENVMSKYLSTLSKFEKIAINTSPFLIQPIICQFDKNNPDLIPVKRFLELLVQRWRQEIQYFEEITQLKDQVIKEFNHFCSCLSDEKSIEFVQEYKMKIVEAILAKSQIEKKQMAGKFCKGIMNGFEDEFLNKIFHYIYYILWTSYATPVPLELITNLKNIFKCEPIKTLKESNITMAFVDICKYIDGHFQAFQIHIEKSKSGIFDMAKNGLRNIFKTKKKFPISSELKTKINKISDERKGCFLLIEEFGEWDKVIKEERMKIQFIVVKMKAKDFLQTNIPFFYDGLMLSSVGKKIDLQQIVKRLPKGLKKLYLDPTQNCENLPKEIEFTEMERLNSNELIIDFKDSEASVCQLLSRVIENLKLPLYLRVKNLKTTSESSFVKDLQFDFHEKMSSSESSLPELDFRLNITIHDISLHQLARAIEIAGPKENNIIVDLRAHKIVFDQTQILLKLQKNNPNYQFFYDNAEFLVKFKNMSTANEIKQLEADFNSLNKFASICLYLDACQRNEMRGDNLMNLMKILQKFALNIIFLYFNIEKSYTSNGSLYIKVEEIAGMGEVLKKMENLCYLNLGFLWNNIGKEEAIELAKALKELKRIRYLSLNLYKNNIKNEGIIEIAKALQELKNISTLDLILTGNDIEFEGGKEMASSIKNMKYILFLSLDLRWNKIGKESAATIAEALQNLTQISNLKLFLRQTGIDNNGVIEIMKAIQTLQKISNLELDLGETCMNDFGAKAIANALTNFKNCFALDLRLSNFASENQNNIKDEGGVEIANAIKNLKNISKLYFSLEGNNSITEKGKSTIWQLKNILPSFDIHFQQKPQ